MRNNDEVKSLRKIVKKLIVNVMLLILLSSLKISCNAVFPLTQSTVAGQAEPFALGINSSC